MTDFLTSESLGLILHTLQTKILSFPLYLLTLVKVDGTLLHCFLLSKAVHYSCKSRATHSQLRRKRTRLGHPPVHCSED